MSGRITTERRNDSASARWRRVSWLVAICTGLMLLIGCSSAQPTDDKPRTEQPGPAHGVEADELADNPCGTPRWDEPPPEVTTVDDSDDD